MFAFFAGRAQAAIDTAVNTTVWKLLYGLTDAQVNDPNWLAADDDGDGLTNGVELAAGTNPQSSKSMVEVTNTTIDPVSASISMSFPTAKGKSYSLESTNTLGPSQNWTALPAVQVNGDGTTKSLTVPISAGVFYHVMVADLDTDGDGVSDWAEYATGYDPLNAHTKNSPVDDHTSLTNELVKENVVTITASAPSAVQPPDAATAATSTGAFTISRGGTLNFSTTTVPLTRSGTAVTDTDYVALPSSVTFAPKVGVIIVPVVPKYNVARQNNATVTLQAAPGAGYTVSSPSSASVVISPAGNTSGTGLRGDYYNSALLPPTSANENNIYTATPKASRVDATVDSAWTTSTLPTASPVPSPTNLAIRWTGQVQPQYSETYYFTVKSDDGVKLWVNGQVIIDKWVTQGNVEWTGAIDLTGGL
ncbi:MAG: PA14 domain-containing protein, partial [Verrucomicrobiota bacterium]|nr:PA14 domain-containing protein [Verrucomicrobiota bacterium]